MRLIFFLFLCSILFLDLKGQSEAKEYDRHCGISHEKDKECGAYAYNIIKPMMAYFEQVNQEINKNNAEMKGKNDRIEELQKEVTKLRIEVGSCTSKDKIVKLLEDKDLSNERFIKSLQQQIDVTESREKQTSMLIEKQTKEINELKDQVESNSEKTTKCSANDKKEMELLKSSNEQLTKELAQLKEKAIAEAKKFDKYEKNLKSEEDKKMAMGFVARDRSGVHNISLSDSYTFEVLCTSDIAGPGWTVIQQRIKGGVDFQRDWDTYRDGFGDFWDGDFFLGLEKIHKLTNEKPHELFIQMKYFNGTTIFAQYDEFSISGEDDQYKIKLGVFSGSRGSKDALDYHRNMKFTTYDRDNDKWNQNCASHSASGGWWYNGCAKCNFNGKYFQDEVYDQKGIFWYGFPLLKEVKMMIRPKAV